MYLSAVLIGLMGSFHCVAMCSSITLLIGGKRRSQKYVLQHFSYNIGRLLGYAILGMIAGVFGRIVWLFGLQQWFSISFGVLLLFSLGLYGSKSIHNPIWKPMLKLTTWLKRNFSKIYRWENSFKGLFIGLLNGFLPCGLVYMAWLGAVNMPSFSASVVYMLIFGLGTWPIMITISFFGGWIKSKFYLKTWKVLPYVIAVLFILRGMDLGIPYLSPKFSIADDQESISNCISIPE